MAKAALAIAGNLYCTSYAMQQKPIRTRSVEEYAEEHYNKDVAAVIKFQDKIQRRKNLGDRIKGKEIYQLSKEELKFLYEKRTGERNALMGGLAAFALFCWLGILMDVCQKRRERRRPYNEYKDCQIKQRLYGGYL